LIVFRFHNARIEFSVEDSDPYERVTVAHNGYKESFTVSSFGRFLKIANKNYLLAPLIEAIIRRNDREVKHILAKINFYLNISAGKKCEMFRYKITKIKDRLILSWKIFFGHK